MTDVETDDLLGESRQTVRHTIDSARLGSLFNCVWSVNDKSSGSGYGRKSGDSAASVGVAKYLSTSR